MQQFTKTNKSSFILKISLVALIMVTVVGGKKFWEKNFVQPILTILKEKLEKQQNRAKK